MPAESVAPRTLAEHGNETVSLSGSSELGTQTLGENALYGKIAL